jgi:exosortase
MTAVPRKTLWFTAYVVVSLGIFWAPLWTLLRLSLSRDTYSHILLIPFISIGLVLMRPRGPGAAARSSPGAAATSLLTAIAVFGLGWKFGSLLPAGGTLALTILSLLFLVWAGFLFFYGTQAFRSLLFPLLFLLLVVPAPQVMIDHCIHWLQSGSSEVTYLLFRVTGTPVFRTGFVFVVPQFTIEVAKECSGIRSSVALLITCLLAGYLFLRSTWARAVLLLAALPVLVIKNGVRIVTLTLLAIHVDRSFLSGNLHHEGGFLFFVLGLLILWPVLRWLQKAEAKLMGPPTRTQGPVSRGPRVGPAAILPHS